MNYFLSWCKAPYVSLLLDASKTNHNLLYPQLAEQCRLVTLDHDYTLVLFCISVHVEYL